jgi:hypothetical protein
MENYDSSRATPSAIIKPGQLPVAESEETTHLSVLIKMEMPLQ